MIYLIHNKNNNTLKIGKSKNPQNRLSQIKTNTSDVLELLFTIEGNDDNIFKIIFKEFHIIREWYNYKEEIIKYFKERSVYFGSQNEEVQVNNPYTKVFINKSNRIFITSLSPSCKSLLLWLFYEIEPGKNFIKINKNRYLKESGTSLNTYKKAILELETNKVLQKISIGDTYFINPDFFFRGDRVSKYPKNVVK